MVIEYSLFNVNINIELTRGRGRVKNRVIIFNYHQLANIFDKKYHHRWTFTDEVFFEQQIIYLKQHYKIIPLCQAIKMANDNEIKDNYACLTFDDGDKSIVNTIIILEKYNIPATFFINSSYLDNKASCWVNTYRYIENSTKYSQLLTSDIKENVVQLRNTLDKDFYYKYSKKIEKLFPIIQHDFKGFTSLTKLKNINTRLFDIGLHGFEHQRFSMMSEYWQKNNLLKDIEILSKLESYKPIFAIPFGRPHDWTVKTVNICMALSLDIVFANGGVNYHRSIGYNRIPVDNKKIKSVKE